MQRTVHVRFRHGDVVLEAAGNRLPDGMDDAEGGIAVVDRIHDHAHSDQVINVLHDAVLPLYFFEDAVQMLRPPVDLRLDPCGSKVCFDGRDRRFERLHAFALLRLDLLFQVLVFFRPEVLEAAVLQLALDRAHAEAVRKRSINIERFARFADLLLLGAIFKGAEIVQAVRQLDDNDAHVLCDSEEELAEVFRLRLLLAQDVALSGFGELRDTVHHAGDVVSEVGAHGVKRDGGAILHHVVQKARDDRVAVHAHVKEHLRHGFRVRVIWFSRFALLILMRVLCKGDRLIEKLHFLRRKAPCTGFP